MPPDGANANSAPARVCIDLGTALTKASAFLGEASPDLGRVAPLPIGAAAGAGHALMTPSAMYVDEGRIYFGPAALEQARAGVAGQRSPILSFKMVLSAREVAPTLEMKPSRAIDPSNTLRYRDALVLYLAYVDQLIRTAIASESQLPRALADAPRRLTSPHWPAYSEAGEIVGRLVEEAALVSKGLGAFPLQREGVPLELALAQVREAEKAEAGAGVFEGVVFEGDSAASAYAYFARPPARFVFVVDMGAGTTDIVGFEWDAAATALREIEGTRQCSVLAGDEIDHIVIEGFMRASRLSELAARESLWRGLRLASTDLKRELFSGAKAVFTHERKRLTLQRQAVMEDASFKAYSAALTAAIAVSLKPVLARAKDSNVKAVSILLAGGGSSLPFLPDLVRAAAPAKSVKLNIERFGANWSLPHMHHPLAGLVPQMAISLGGALAPVATRARRAAQHA
ncbi:MAG: Hsp70 family protein [Hyphomonadaceae bacterium]